MSRRRNEPASWHIFSDLGKASTKPPSIWWQVVDALPDGIAVVDANGLIVGTNFAFRTSFTAMIHADPVQIDPNNDELLAAIHRVASGQKRHSRAASREGTLFECHRLDVRDGLVAVMAPRRSGWRQASASPAEVN